MTTFQATEPQEEIPFACLPERAACVRPHPRRMLQAVLDFAEGR